MHNSSADDSEFGAERAVSPDFQLEYNLQTSRRHLVYFLEDVDAFECLNCNRLTNCGCPPPESRQNSSYSELDITYTDESSEESFEIVTIDPPVAPEPETLPHPIWAPRPPSREDSPEDFEKELQLWVYNAEFNNGYVFGTVPTFEFDERLNDEIHSTWPPLPGSVWYRGTSPSPPKPPPLPPPPPPPPPPLPRPRRRIAPIQRPSTARGRQNGSLPPWSPPRVDEWLRAPWERQPWFRSPFQLNEPENEPQPPENVRAFFRSFAEATALGRPAQNPPNGSDGSSNVEVSSQDHSRTV